MDAGTAAGNVALAYHAPKHVLDLGCGNGRNAVYLAEKGCEVIAIDFSPAALNKAARAARLADVSAFAGSCLETNVDIYRHGK